MKWYNGSMHLGRMFGALILLACDRGETAAPAEPARPTTQAQPAVVAPTDRDSDGFVDAEDPCPDQPGPAGAACPPADLDRDGLLDKDDRCPDAPETINHVDDADGCPDELPPELVALNGPILDVEFDLDKDTIRKKSFAALDRIVALLIKYPGVRIEVSGHIEPKDVDDSARRVRISGRRAASIQKYFVAHGVAPDRIVTRDAFDSEPLADSKTDAGRSLNRRARIKLLTP